MDIDAQPFNRQAKLTPRGYGNSGQDPKEPTGKAYDHALRNDQSGHKGIGVPKRLHICVIFDPVLDRQHDRVENQRKNTHETTPSQPCGKIDYLEDVRCRAGNKILFRPRVVGS